MTLLDNEMLNFQTVCAQKLLFFAKKKKVRRFCSAKAPYNFSAKYITTIAFMSTARLKEFLTNDFFKITII